LSDRRTLLREIRALLATPDRGEATPPVAHLEHVLTAGYAHALALEAEQLRLERQLGAAARRLADDGRARDEVTALADRISSAEGDLSHLRGLLEDLLDRTRAARAA
jgi:hypothetical protein